MSDLSINQTPVAGATVKPLKPGVSLAQARQAAMKSHLDWAMFSKDQATFIAYGEKLPIKPMVHLHGSDEVQKTLEAGGTYQTVTSHVVNGIAETEITTLPRTEYKGRLMRLEGLHDHWERDTKVPLSLGYAGLAAGAALGAKVAFGALERLPLSVVTLRNGGRLVTQPGGALPYLAGVAASGVALYFGTRALGTLLERKNAAPIEAITQ